MATLGELFKGYKTLPSFSKSAKKNFFESFGWILLVLLILYLPFLRPWWWLFFPMILSTQLKKLYLWWVAWDFDYKKTKWVMLEIITPKEVLVPIKAMDDVFQVMFNPLADSANFREIWCEGELDECPYWASFELLSTEGEVHILARISTKHQKMFENAMYAHYPEIEIREVEDYAEVIPKNIPNGDWDMYGEDYVLRKPAPYPIKTYESFFEPQGEKISAEEKRIDPLNSLLESMSKLGQGEYYWLQYILMGAYEQDEPNFKKEGQEIVNKLARRPGPKKESSGGMFGFLDETMRDLVEAFHVLIGGQPGEGEQSKEKFITEEGEREMVLTPGEREIMTQVERKMSKPTYRTVIRGMYIAKRENFSPANKYIARTYFSHFQTNHMNFISFDTTTRTKVHDIFRKRRVFGRARKMIRNAFLRFPPAFPDRRGVTSLFTPEELATMFHLPIKITGTTLPTLERVESRKGGPPSNLPIQG